MEGEVDGLEGALFGWVGEGGGSEEEGEEDGSESHFEVGDIGYYIWDWIFELGLSEGKKERTLGKGKILHLWDCES